MLPRFLVLMASIPSLSRHRRKMNRVVSLANRSDVVCLQETRGRSADLLELSHFLPMYSFSGSFSTTGTSAGVAFLVGAAFASKYPDGDMVEVVRGRIAILRCRGPNAPPVDIVNVHLVDAPRLPPAAQLARLAGRLQSFDNCTTFMLGDFNFLTPGDGRLDLTTGAHTYDDSPVARAFHDLFPTYAELRAEGYSRRQFRDGHLQLLSRLDKAYTNMPTQDIMACHPSCAYTKSLADPHLESDHAPMALTFSRPRSKGPFRVPRWVPDHPAYQAFADEYLAFSAPPQGRSLWGASPDHHGTPARGKAGDAIAGVHACSNPPLLAMSLVVPGALRVAQARLPEAGGDTSSAARTPGSVHGP